MPRSKSRFGKHLNKYSDLSRGIGIYPSEQAFKSKLAKRPSYRDIYYLSQVRFKIVQQLESEVAFKYTRASEGILVFEAIINLLNSRISKQQDFVRIQNRPIILNLK